VSPSRRIGNDAILARAPDLGKVSVALDLDARCERRPGVRSGGYRVIQPAPPGPDGATRARGLALEELRFTASLWRWPAQDAWRFVTVPSDLADAIRFASGPPRGFGSVRVEVTVGATTWRTSVFPDAGLGTYVLPVKKAVRQAEDLDDGDPVTVTLVLLDA
jgi:hypothetical protein